MSTPNFVAAFLTGQSVRGCTDLSAVQREFQRMSAIPSGNWLHRNFPYQDSFPFPARVPLLQASVNNITGYCASRFQAFRDRYTDAVAEVFSRFEVTIVCAGSSGLELLNNLALPADLLRRMHVFAYGPVSRALPTAASSLVVQGTYDVISRAFHRRADHRYPCPHMGYLAAPETLRLFDGYCRRVLSSTCPGR